MKVLTEEQVDDLLKLKFGSVVERQPRIAYVADKVLGKVFGVSRSQRQSKSA